MSFNLNSAMTTRIIWGVAWVVVFSALFAGCFLPIVPPADSTQLQMLSAGDTAWMLCATGLVLIMTPGLAFFYGGMVQSHSIISTMLQCTICLGLVGVLWVIIGFSLAFGEDCGSFIGNPWTYLWFRNVGTAPNPTFAATIPFQLFALFQLKFAVITPALTAGGYIERIRFGPFLVFITIYMLIVYCPVAHWVWHPAGFIRVWGVKDFAGGAVVHINAGCSALAGAIAIGRRRAVKRHETLSPSNVPFVILGTGMLWFGWFGFNGGSALAANEVAAAAFINTNTACAAAMFIWMILEGMAGRKPTAVGACVGAVVGLVVITPAAGYITVGESLFFGGFGATVCFVTIWLMHFTAIDDGLDAFASHGVGGMLGCILTGAFAQPDGVVHGPAGEQWKYFGFYWATIVIVGSWSFVFTWIILKTISFFVPVRLSPGEEEYGLDQTQHGETIYSNYSYEKKDEDAVPRLELDEGQMNEDPVEGIYDPNAENAASFPDADQRQLPYPPLSHGHHLLPVYTPATTPYSPV